MSLALRCYLVVLFVLICAWIWLRGPALAILSQAPQIIEFVGVISLYLFSHVIRMLRLALLTLDKREKVFPLLAAHTLTAFPSSFLPFKIGEVIRLSAFFYVYQGRRKALAVWLAERFGDLVVIAVAIFGLYTFDITVPHSMRVIFVLFVLASVLSLLALFAVAKVFVYLNRHLVLVSHSDRGLALLRASHTLRRLERDIYSSVEGRLVGFLLLSALIWVLEICALALFIQQFYSEQPDLGNLFASGLLASLPGGAASTAIAFGLYQSLALIVLTFIFLAAVWLAARFNLQRL